ncbi:Hypothetical protein I5071_53840 [Sandaracinus amylolyticus]|nr:Hypothetical protein I5071_53840 [Sandaracinus amylolyticus]
MSTDVTTEIVIRRPRAEVAAFMFDPHNDVRWTTGVVESRPRDPGPLRRGSRVERISKFLGRRFGYEYEVVDTDERSFVEMKVERPFPMHIRYELEDVPEGTRTRIHARGDAGGFFRIAGPLLNGMVRRNITRDLELLRGCLEHT